MPMYSRKQKTMQAESRVWLHLHKPFATIGRKLVKRKQPHAEYYF
jgi:hypothetical protein